MLKELRKTVIRNVDHWYKDLESIKSNQSKSDNSITKMKTELKTVNSKLNNVEERISDLEDRITEITQSEQQTDKWKKMKATYEIYGLI